MPRIKNTMLHKDSTFGFNPSSKAHKSWFDRTFSKLDDGGLRGNTFLMLVSTAGCSYFYMPYFAKVSGLYAIIIFLSLTAFVSYYSSSKLYYAFKATQAKTFNECTEIILGSRLGFLANLMIFIHVYGSTLGIWAFSYKIINNVILINFPYLDNPGFQSIFSYCYFIFVFLLLFLFNYFGNLNKIKSISAVGLLITCFPILQIRDHPGIDI